MQSLSSTKIDSWLQWFLRGILILGFFILVARLVELQIIKGSYFRALAEENRIRKIPITAPRGEILARSGELLIGNNEIPAELSSDGTIKKWQRAYPMRDDFAHASGYLGSVSEEELGKVDPKCPEKGPRISTVLLGRSGLEEHYDCRLRGIDGEELVEVDTFGKKIRTLGVKPPLQGEQIKTTIDYGLQSKVAQIFESKELLDEAHVTKERRGAVIVSDYFGQILAFYSAPSFDPSAFLDTEKKDIGKLLTDSSLPLFNRVISGSYHPGSVFKMVTSIAGLEEGRITKDFYYDDPGVITINKFSYANWFFTQYGQKEGKINMQRALARSTDTYYYKVGEFLGVEALASWARRFGYGQKTGIDLPGEISGLVPDPAWKKEVKKENWFLGNTYHMAIGQGDLTATPLEVSMSIVAIANGGKLCTPYLVDNGDINPHCTNIGIKPEYLDQVKQGMTEACTTGGTGYPFFDFEPRVACKTGTAETEKEGQTHAWFTVFGPVDETQSTMPPITVTVLVENGGEGSKVAAPIARDIFNYWFYDRNP